jgi:hypothetical protein
MVKINWQLFLNKWNRLVLSSFSLSQALPEEVAGAGNLGCPGASEVQISQAEARLGIRLPPSYRAFLLASDGWFTGTDATSRLFSIQETDWFTLRFSDILQAWLTGYHMEEPPSISDSEYLVYGESQDPSLVSTEDLQASLAIGIGADESLYLLNPRVVEQNGEWEAWFFAAWLPGAIRYRSFDELMQAEYRKVKDLVDEDKANVRSQKSPDSVWNDLSSLLAEFEKEIESQTKIASSESWVLAQYEVGIRDELQCGWQQLSQIQKQTRDPEEVRHALVSLMDEFENRWHQKFLDMKQEPETNLLEKTRLSATGEGARQTMGIIQWFLKEHKVL